MFLKEKIDYLKTKGLTIKLISNQTNIKENTLYNFTSGKRNLSSEKEEKIENFISIFLTEEEKKQWEK